MKEKNETYYITTPIYYPSGKLHIGHSYTTVAADTLARFKRLKGYDVMFLTGTDEHGQKIQRKARETGVNPKEYVDGIVSGILELWKTMKITNDRFIRTTDENHVETVQKIFKKLYDSGDIYKSHYEGMYCTPCESFWTETQLKDGCCPDCGRTVEMTKEESYFFRLSDYTDRLLKHYEENPEFIQPKSRLNEMINNFIKPGLEDLCVSRTTFDWGIPVTFDENHVVYVWLDALSNYVTALGYHSEDDSLYKKYWPADLHLVGKEIVRFHTIIWPAILMALGEPLPKKIYGHGWLLLEGGKISKSKSNSESTVNIVDPVILIERYGVDAVRYFLLREVAFGSDGVFSNEAMINRINADLVNDLGNLLSRTIAMIEKYFAGSIPENTLPGEYDDELKDVVLSAAEKVDSLLENMMLNQAITELWTAVRRANKYIDETRPWILAKDPANNRRLGAVMYNLAETLRIISIVIEPFMPDTPAKIREQLGLPGDDNSLTWESAFNWGGYPKTARVKKGEIVFPRIDVEKEFKELEKIGESLKPAGNSPDSSSSPEGVITAEEFISIEDFTKVKLKVAEIVSAQKIEKTKKLLKLTLNTGEENVTVVSGIAEYYTPGQLPGKRIILVSNLKPVTLKGVESRGMILAAVSEKTGELVLVTTDKPIGAGTAVG